MNRMSSRNLRWLFTAVVLLSFGFILGTIRADIFTFAQNEQAYEGRSAQTSAPTKALQTARNMEKAFQFVAQKAQPSVVTVYTQKEVKVQPFPSPFKGKPFHRFFDEMFPDRDSRSREITGLGSGFIIREDGYIVTNYHVIKDVDEIQVKLDNDEREKASIVGTDPKTDLAVIKVERTGLPSINFAQSEDVHVGQWAIAIGSPFHLPNSVSIGAVSATHRSITTTARNSIQYQDFIQTDAAINRGNSGGPLLNIDGNVVGVNTMIQSTSGGNQGIGFAISANLAQRTAKDLIQHGHVKRPWLGVAIQELDPEVREEHFGEEHGVIVAQVVKNSPAEEAGIKQGDLITKFDGNSVDGPGDLQQKVLSHSIGDRVTVTLKRDGETKNIKTTLAKLPEDTTMRASRPDETPSQTSNLNKLGLQLRNIDPRRSGEFGIQRDQPFFVVESVQPGSPAHQQGIREDQVILEVDRRTFDSVDELNQYITQRMEENASSVLFLIRSEGNYIYRPLQLPSNLG